jgi:hypothetical protein
VDTSPATVNGIRIMTTSRHSGSKNLSLIPVIGV